MICIDSFQSQGHRKLEFDAIAVLPHAPNAGKSAGLHGVGNSIAIDGKHWAWRCPAGNSDIECVVFGLRTGHLDLDFVVEWVLGFLLQSVASASVIPLHRGRCEEIYIYAVFRTKIRTDMVVGRQLRESSGTARPLLPVPNLLASGGIVRVVERGAIGLNGPRAENGVVKHALHAVAVARVFGDTQQVACDLEVAIGAAWSLKAGVTGRKTVAQLTRSGLTECFIWSPATRGKALCLDQHFETVLGGTQMLFAS